MLGVAVRGEPEQRVDRGEPGVARPRAVAASVFEVVEEAGDQSGVELGEVEPAGLLGDVFFGVAEQQLR